MNFSGKAGNKDRPALPSSSFPLSRWDHLRGSEPISSSPSAILVIMSGLHQSEPLKLSAAAVLGRCFCVSPLISCQDLKYAGQTVSHVLQQSGQSFIHRATGCKTPKIAPPESTNKVGEQWPAAGKSAVCCQSSRFDWANETLNPPNAV